MGHILTAIALCLFTNAAELPDGVEWVNPPEAAPPESFIIFTRSTERPDAEEPTAHIWQIDPQARTVTPRVRFRPSRWAPNLFSTNLDFPRPSLVRMQIPDPDRSPAYSVDLFDIDFTTWRIRTIHQDAQATPLFWHDGTVYIDVGDRHHRTASSLRRLDAGEYTLRNPSAPFKFVRTIAQPPNHHLVQRPDSPQDHYAVFNPADGTLTDIGTLPQSIASYRTAEIVLTEDLGKIAYHAFDRSSMRSEQIGSWHSTTSTIVLIDRASGERTTIDFRLWVSTGSGIGHFISSPLIHFTDDAKLRYTVYESPDNQGRLRDWMNYEYDPGTETTEQISCEELRRGNHQDPPRTAGLPTAGLPTAGIPVADILRPVLGETSTDLDIAIAYLIRQHGVEFDRPSALIDSSFVFSSDNKRFILKTRNSGRDDVFFYADLDANTLTKIPIPPEINRQSITIIYHRPTQP